MRRGVGFVLVGLGAFLLVIGLMSKFYAVPKLEKLPLDQYSRTLASATGTLFDRESGQPKTGVEITSTRVIRGDVKAGTDSTAVWDVFLNLETQGTLIRATTERVALDRTKSTLKNCCGNNVNNEPVRHSGIEYHFPFDTQKKTYQYFDNTALKPFPMRYVGTQTVNGLRTYQFEQPVEATDIGELEVPGAWIGKPNEPSVTVRQFYANVRTVYVEPVTGIIVKGNEQQRRTLREPGSDVDVVTLLEAPLAFTDGTVRALVKKAKDDKASLNLIDSTIPILGVVLGLVLLVVGALLVLLRSRRDDGVYDDDLARTRVV
jgi:hypothetical protein